VISGMSGQQSYITHIREVALLSGERIVQVFCPDRGLTQEPPVRGKVLITTNQRILAFSRDDDRNETYLVPIEELKGVAVNSGERALLQRNFGMQLTRLGYRRRRRSGGRHWWQGIGLKGQE